MILPSPYKNIYFIGIGGIGMSALASYFFMQGIPVSGYDKTPSNITDNLQKQGIKITFVDDFSTQVKSLDTSSTLVVYTPAIPITNSLFNGFKKAGFTLIKRAELLGLITKNTICLAVAGTHGKTTTSAILAHLLFSAGKELTAFLGGVSENYQSNLIFKGTEFTVVEADEFDRSFLQLHPFIAGITAMDADHLDIYKNEKNILAAFKEFADLVPKNGILLHKKGLPLLGKTVAVEEKADYEACNIRIIEGCYVFDFKTPDGLIKDLLFNLPGRHNLFNASLAISMALNLGLTPDELRKPLENFKGVKRRFTYALKSNKNIVIDDYAHHPEEIDAIYKTVKEMYPQEKCLVVFQPHLYSRTRDFADAFANSLASFDQIILLDIYPARELPIPGIDSQWLLEKINNPNKSLVTKNQLPEVIQRSAIQLNVILGAGDISEEVQPIIEYLSHEN